MKKVEAMMSQEDLQEMFEAHRDLCHKKRPGKLIGVSLSTVPIFDIFSSFSLSQDKREIGITRQRERGRLDRFRKELKQRREELEKKEG